MNIDVGSSVALITLIVAPSAAGVVLALKRYARAHRELVRWRGDSQRAK